MLTQLIVQRANARSLCVHDWTSRLWDVGKWFSGERAGARAAVAARADFEHAKPERWPDSSARLRCDAERTLGAAGNRPARVPNTLRRASCIDGSHAAIL